MADWTTNTIMLWDGQKVTDHGRAALTMPTERIGTDKRMANGTLRRYHIASKRSWSTSWENLPSTNAVVAGYKTADGGMAGEDIEEFYRNNNGAFRLVLKRGSAIDKVVPTPSSVPYEDDDFIICDVMITEYSRDVIKRGAVDFWNISITLEEV